MCVFLCSQITRGIEMYGWFDSLENVRAGEWVLTVNYFCICEPFMRQFFQWKTVNLHGNDYANKFVSNKDWNEFLSNQTFTENTFELNWKIHYIWILRWKLFFFLLLYIRNCWKVCTSFGFIFIQISAWKIKRFYRNSIFTVCLNENKITIWNQAIWKYIL